MRDFHLRFYVKKRWFDGLIDLMDDEDNAPPKKSGAWPRGLHPKTGSRDDR
jgi:hypothetical protein